jgi:ABC-type nitrate/sulfonate/bicarbonate transport system substrate-binding protein
MKTPRLRRALCASVLTVLIAVTGCSAGGTSSGDGPRTIRVGYLKVIQWTHLADIAAHADKNKINIELKEFKTSNEVLVALSSGSVDIGDIGYNHLASALDRGQSGLEFIAGLSSQGSALIQRKGAGINDWQDLRGRRVGGSRGSTQYTQLATGMAKAGMSVENDIEFINLTSATDMNIALRNGDVDAIMQWEPSASMAIVEGYGATVPGVAETLYQDTFEVSSGVAARSDFVKENPEAVQAFTEAYWKSYQKITSDRDYWVRTFGKLVEIDRNVLDMASRNARPDFGMNQADIARMMEALSRTGVTSKNMFDELKKHLNYDFIAKASGRSTQELGAS